MILCFSSVKEVYISGFDGYRGYGWQNGENYKYGEIHNLSKEWKCIDDMRIHHWEVTGEKISKVSYDFPEERVDDKKYYDRMRDTKRRDRYNREE